MSVDIGYYAQVEGGVFGNPDGGTPTPVTRAALQEASFQNMLRIKEQLGPLYVPPGLGYGPNAPEWATQPGRPANMPTIGWTVQNEWGGASPFRPYSLVNAGRIPDWEGDDASGISAGAYDMNPAMTAFGFTQMNRAPIGGAVVEYGETPNVNAPKYDISGQIGRMEY